MMEAKISNDKYDVTRDSTFMGVTTPKRMKAAVDSRRAEPLVGSCTYTCMFSTLAVWVHKRDIKPHTFTA